MLNLRSSKSLKIFLGGILFLSQALSEATQKGLPTSWDEVLLELSDLRYELKAAQVDFDILREKLQKKNTPEKAHEDPRTALWEKKISHLEETVEKLVNDVRTLREALRLAEEKAGHQSKMLEEVASLQDTLKGISKAMHIGSTTYKVKAGDSLSQIAKAHKVSIDAIKKLNPHLKEDKIRVGEQLQMPHES